MTSSRAVHATSGPGNPGADGTRAASTVTPAGAPNGSDTINENGGRAGGSGCSLRRGALMALAMCFMSSAGTGFALVEGVDPLLKAAWRLWATSMIQLPFFVYQLRQATPAVVAKWKQQWPGLALSGFFLGVHFMSWVWSIDHTSLAHSLLWVSSHPLVVVGGMYLGYVFGRLKSCRLRCGELLDKADKPVPLETLGAVIGFLGGAVMVLDAQASDTPVTIEGDAVAFLGAVAIVVYLAVGRVMREGMPLFLYAFPVTFTSAVVSFAASAGMEGSTVLGQDGASLFGWFFDTEWLLLVLYQGFGPGLLGHTMVNNLLEHLSPLIVSVVLLMEPLVGSLIGFAFGKQDMPGLFTWLGGPVLVVGAVMVTVGQHRRPAAPKSKSQADLLVPSGSLAGVGSSADGSDGAAKPSAPILGDVEMTGAPVVAV